MPCRHQDQPKHSNDQRSSGSVSTTPSSTFVHRRSSERSSPKRPLPPFPERTTSDYATNKTSRSCSPSPPEHPCDRWPPRSRPRTARDCVRRQPHGSTTTSTRPGWPSILTTTFDKSSVLYSARTCESHAASLRRYSGDSNASGRVRRSPCRSPHAYIRRSPPLRPGDPSRGLRAAGTLTLRPVSGIVEDHNGGSDARSGISATSPQPVAESPLAHPKSPAQQGFSCAGIHSLLLD